MRVLFEDGDWRLLGLIDNSEIQHLCTQPYGGESWWYYAYDGSCGVCHAEIPESILGLRNLYRWGTEHE